MSCCSAVNSNSRNEIGKAVVLGAFAIPAIASIVIGILMCARVIPVQQSIPPYGAGVVMMMLGGGILLGFAVNGVQQAQAKKAETESS
ncbi:hypothetical protein ACFLR2_00980 [Chlamydiota bacterium]